MIPFLGWIKFAVIAGILSGAIFLIQDYKRLGVKVEAQKATIVRLTNNVTVLQTSLEGTLSAMKEADTECIAAAERFLSENDIWKKIDESADPLTDAANFNPNEQRKPLK